MPTKKPKSAPKPKAVAKANSASRPKPHIHYHKDGSIWAKGKLLNGVATGYWEWFRKDGVRMRSGYFERGAQTGEWTTYDQRGKAFKVTVIKPKAAKQGAQGGRGASDTR